MPVKPTTILVADDDPQLLRLMSRNLQLEGYEVLTARNGELALEQIKTQAPDLVLLDVIMPKLDGFSVCERVREFSTVPIILVTARGLEQDKVRGLDLGADDYLAKPFSLDELLARVRAVLRRSHFRSPEATPAFQPIVRVADLTIDSVQHQVKVAEKEIVLTPLEYSLLTYMAQYAGRILTQDLLLGQVWGEDYLGESHILQVNINRLRQKIEVDPAHPRFIHTKIGVGYFLAATPEEFAAQ
jgi:DNA-binding response OmpR family regulator